MRTRTVLVATGVAALSFGMLAPAGATSPSTLSATALTSLNRLVEIDVIDGDVDRSTAVRGLRFGEKVVGIDYRPATGQLYGVIRTRSGDGRIAVIDPQNGSMRSWVTLVGEDGEDLELDGSAFGVDFNPVPDRLRITSDDGQNLRVNVDTGVAIIDGRLGYAAGDDASGSPDVVASAYTNGDQDPAGSTTLYGLDARRDTLVLQDPPNDGVLSTIDDVEFNVTASTGLDISTDSDVAVASVPGLLTSTFYVVDLEDGDTLARETVLLTSITDLALLPGQ